jgi:Fe2+ transport system protein FeoA
MKGILKRKKTECAACLKNFVRKLVKKIYKMGFLEGSGVPVLYIGHTVPKG